MSFYEEKIELSKVINVEDLCSHAERVIILAHDWLLIDHLML